MQNVCHQCGLYRADKIIDPDVPAAICPECGHAHPFHHLPLLIVSGASGVGKSTVCNLLAGTFQDAVVLDSDILWFPDAFLEKNGSQAYFNVWLRLCKNIGQSGKPVVLFGAGFGVPENVEPCVERRYFSAVHYLALVCADEALSRRLQERPAWRGTRDPAFIEEHQRFNRWFMAYNDEFGDPPIRLLDTGERSVEETVMAVQAWIQEHLPGR